MMNPAQLKAWRVANRYSQEALGELLGYTKESIQNMEYGKTEIRNCVSLACAAISVGIKFYTGPQE